MSENPTTSTRLTDHRSFVLFWCARTFSNGAFMMQGVAVGWQIYALTNDPFDLGLVGLVQFLPLIAMAIIVGQLLDMFDRRKIAVACQLGKALAAFLLAVGSAQGWLTRDLMLALVLLSGTARAFEVPTMHAILPGIVPLTILPRAIAASAAAQQTAVICGPSLGGFLYALGPTAVYVTCAFVFVAASFLMTRVQLAPTRVADTLTTPAPLREAPVPPPASARSRASSTRSAGEGTVSQGIPPAPARLHEAPLPVPPPQAGEGTAWDDTPSTRAPAADASLFNPPAVTTKAANSVSLPHAASDGLPIARAAGDHLSIPPPLAGEGRVGGNKDEAGGNSDAVQRKSISLATLFAGFAYIRKRPILMGAISLDLFAVLLGGVTALLPIYARDILDAGPWALGVLRSAPAVGALATTVFLARHAISGRAGAIMFAAVGAFGLASVVFALSTSMTLSFIALAVYGAADSISVVIRQSLIQLRTPYDMLGRVAAVNSMFTGASGSLGEFRAGAIAAAFGAVTSALIGGLGAILVMLIWMWAFPQLRRVDRLAGEGRETG